jgi:hypothetical protein
MAATQVARVVTGGLQHEADRARMKIDLYSGKT